MNTAFALGFLLVTVVTFSGLWKNLFGGRKPRQRQKGIFHRLCVMLPHCAWLERFSVWWILKIVNPIANASFDLVFWLGRRLWPRHAQSAADFVQVWIVPSFLLDFLAWPFAYGFLKAKAKAEQNGEQP
jgi:hypothetical protein